MIEVILGYALSVITPEVVVAILVLIRLLYHYHLKCLASHVVETQRCKRVKDVPSAPAIPILGSLPFLGKYPPRQITKWVREQGYSTVLRVRFGPMNAIVLNDLESIRDGFLRNGHRLSGRVHTPLLEEMTRGYGIMFIDMDTKRGRRQKNFGHSAFRKVTIQAHMNEIIAEESLTAVHAMEKQILDKKADDGEYLISNYRCASRIPEQKFYGLDVNNNNDWKLLKPDAFLHKFTSNVMCHLLFGRTFKMHETEYNSVLEETPIQARKSFGYFMIAFLVPCLRNMPIIKGAIDEALCLRRETFKMIKDLTDEHMRNFHGVNKNSDFIDCFLEEMLDKSEAKKETDFTYQQLLTYVFDVFTAGAETTAETLVWGLLYFAQNLELQNKLREEIMTFSGNGEETLCMTELSRMNLMRASLHEVLRIRPITALGLAHRATESCEVNGFYVPKDSIVLSNIWSVHHNPEIFPNPEVFDPYRHISPTGEFTPSNHVISFSMGPRRCLGKKIAETAILFMFSTILRNFEFRLPKIWNQAEERYVSDVPDMNGTEGQVLLPPEYDIELRKIK